METTVILAKFWGMFMTVFSIAFLLNPKLLTKLFEYVKDEKTLFILGLFSLFIGMAAVAIHNKWENGWQAVISVLGWFALLKGFLRFTFTNAVSNIISKFEFYGIKWLLLLVLALGCTLLYFAYFVEL